MKNLIKEIVDNANRNYGNYDNRNKATKAINTVLDGGEVKINIQEKGRIWTNPRFTKGGELFQFNIEIKGFGIVSAHYTNSFEPLNLATILAGFLRRESVQNKIGLKYKTHQPCSRCNGKGIIPQFHYYCGGICFDCYGSGIDKQLKEVSI